MERRRCNFMTPERSLVRSSLSSSMRVLSCKFKYLSLFKCVCLSVYLYWKITNLNPGDSFRAIYLERLEAVRALQLFALVFHHVAELRPAVTSTYGETSKFCNIINCHTAHWAYSAAAGSRRYSGVPHAGVDARGRWHCRPGTSFIDVTILIHQNQRCVSIIRNIKIYLFNWCFKSRNRNINYFLRFFGRSDFDVPEYWNIINIFFSNLGRLRVHLVFESLEAVTHDLHFF